MLINTMTNKVIHYKHKTIIVQISKNNLRAINNLESIKKIFEIISICKLFYNFFHLI